MNKNKKSKLYLVLAAIFILLILGGYFTYKRLVSADTAVTYPAWLDSELVQKATSVWTAEQKNWLNWCSSAGSTTISPATDQEKSLLGQNAKSFVGWTGTVDNENTNFASTDFYMDKFRISMVPTKFQPKSDSMSYQAKFKYMLSNPNDKPIYIQTGTLRYDAWGIPNDPKAFAQVGSQDTKINNGVAVRLNPGEYTIAESPEFIINRGDNYSTLLFATQIYDRNADNTVHWGGAGAQSAFCIADPFSYKSLGGQDLIRPSFPNWFDSQTVNNFNNVWTAAQKYQLNYSIYNNYVSKLPTTSVETSQVGAGAVAFEAGGAYTHFTGFPTWYTSKYKVALTPLQFDRQADGNYLAKFRVGLSNTGTAPLKVKNVWANFLFYQVDSTSATVSGSGRAVFSGGSELTLSPGQYITSDTNVMTVKPSSYYFLTIADALKRDDGTYDESGPSSHFDIQIPIPLSVLGVAQPTVTATATRTSTATMTAISTVTSTATATATATSTTTVIPTATSTASPPPVPGYSLHQGFNAVGSNVPINPDYLNALGLYLYKFDGPLNKWFVFPGNEKFSTYAFKGYYIYAPVAKDIVIDQTMVLTTSHQVSKGWNLLWTNQAKTLQTLLLNIDGTVKPTQTWIDEGKVHSKIFQITSDSATKACNYFSILSSSTSSADCVSNIPANIASLTSGKDFWVYVY